MAVIDQILQSSYKFLERLQENYYNATDLVFPNINGELYGFYSILRKS